MYGIKYLLVVCMLVVYYVQEQNKQILYILLVQAT